MVQNREEVQNYLSQNDIQTLNHYPIPVHLQRAYKKSGYAAGMFPNAEKYAKEEVSLPLWVGMGQEEMALVAAYVNEVLEEI